MSDKYPDFDTLSANEIAGKAYRIAVRRAAARFALAAIHGGGIEAGTSELADAVAGDDLSFYSFEALKTSGNRDLHITSAHFDEPMCLTICGASETVITLHGEHTEADGEGVFLGGLDEKLGATIQQALEDNGFTVRKHPDPKLQGREARNICNRGQSGIGVQLELSRTVRKEMFASLSREGRKHPTARFFSFVDAMRTALESLMPQA
jgi:phage replication-related protein YjqB (UPF0714/DUF867 family)